jgi:hypothetical protein
VGDRCSDSSFNFLEAPDNQLRAVGIEQRKMIHDMIDTASTRNGTSSKGANNTNVKSADETQPFLDADFRLMYTKTVSCLLRLMWLYTLFFG